MKRMWINQPSTLQPLHHLHGIRVYASPEREGIMRIYFLDGDVISMECAVNALSLGWL